MKKEFFALLGSALVFALLLPGCPVEEDGGRATPIIIDQPESSSTQALLIQTTPTANTPYYGDVLEVTAVASDLGTGGSLSYQWYKNTTDSNSGGLAVGSNSPQHKPELERIAAAPTGETVYQNQEWYYVVVSNGGSKTVSNTAMVFTYADGPSAPAEKKKNEADSISLSGSITGAANSTKGAIAAELSVSVTPPADWGTGGEVSYQWYSNTQNNNGTAGVITKVGSNSSTYRPSTAVVGTLYYFVVVTYTNTGKTSAGYPINGPTTSYAKSGAVSVQVTAP